MPRGVRGLAPLLLGGVLVSLAGAASAARIALIIDDLGNDLQQGRRVLALPGAVACAILPHTPYAAVLAREARASGKEVILHLPMEAADGTAPGPGALYRGMSAPQVAAVLEAALQSVPHAMGVSNHMGGLLTEHAEPMTALMAALARRGGLLFVDSRTSARTVAARIAAEHGIAHLARDVFLDDERRTPAIARQFAHLLAIARERGAALAIAHPYPETLALLERELPRLALGAVTLVSLKELVNARPRGAREPGG